MERKARSAKETPLDTGPNARVVEWHMNSVLTETALSEPKGRLRPDGVAARLGAEGSYWQQQAQGTMHRQLRLMNETVRFYQQQEFEDR